MEIEFEEVEGIGVFCPSGQLDYSSTLKLMEAITTRFSSGANRFLVDLQYVQYVNSAGYSILGILFSEAKKSGVKIALCGIPGLTKGSLDKVPIPELELFFDTREDAIQDLNLMVKGFE